MQKRKKALWLAALLQPKVYSHKVGDTDVSARAVAGSKCFCGDKAFWRNVDTLFNTSDKNSSTDSSFQMMPLPKEWETDLQSILSGADAKKAKKVVN